jgi:hypothetical protein
LPLKFLQVISHEYILIEKLTPKSLGLWSEIRT